MANLSCISKHCVTLRTVVVTEGNVIQPCIDPVESPVEKNAEWKRVVKYEVRLFCWLNFAALSSAVSVAQRSGSVHPRTLQWQSGGLKSCL